MFVRRVKLWRDVRGATAIEYGLILGLVFVALAVGVSVLGKQVNVSYSSLNTKMPNPS